MPSSSLSSIHSVSHFSCGGEQAGVSMLGKCRCLLWDAFKVKIDNA